METKREVEWVSMAENEDWLMRPVLERMCLYESLKDGTLDLEDIARMNESLDVRAENQRRYEKANRDKD